MVQTTSRSHVSSGRNAIMKMHIAMPSGATTQTSGVRNGRWQFGRATRKTRMPAQTIANAEQRADRNQLAQNARAATGRRASAANIPVTIVPIHGVRNVG